MGAGKTILIGAIVATEFAMAIEYPEPMATSVQFVENALVFAPGKTIIESLRELARIPYERTPATAPLQVVRGGAEADVHPRRREGHPGHPGLVASTSSSRTPRRSASRHDPSAGALSPHTSSPRSRSRPRRRRTCASRRSRPCPTSPSSATRPTTRTARRWARSSSGSARPWTTSRTTRRTSSSS